ncbi:hypothetical protein OBV_00900 [Oscillibacter valericigenes Sjm18-20]|nr:hypothetical protein OBV_00900 [Oscillibacter valericigenes Sjm18-20]
MDCTPKVRQYDINNFGGVLMPKGIAYSEKFKHRVVEDMRENRLAHKETARKYGINDRKSAIGSISTLKKDRRDCILNGVGEAAKGIRYNWARKLRKT